MISAATPQPIPVKYCLCHVEYFPARAPYLPADGPLTAEEVQRERGKKWIRSGLFLSEERVLEAMEPENPGARLPVNRKKDGSLSGSLASTAQFRALEGYVFHLLADMVSEIASGNVSPNPYSRGAVSRRNLHGSPNS